MPSYTFTNFANKWNLCNQSQYILRRPLAGNRLLYPGAGGLVWRMPHAAPGPVCVDTVLWWQAPASPAPVLVCLPCSAQRSVLCMLDLGL
eukprot:gene3449-biopygen3484